jgi:hypothetical protein
MRIIARFEQEMHMVISKKHLSRRTVLRGLGVSLSLPLLDAMVPAQTLLRKTAAAPRTRLVAIEMVHGAAGSTAIGRARNYWSPAGEGTSFELTQTLRSLEPFREYLTIISDTDLLNASSLSPAEDGDMADHARSSAVFLTAAHPRMTAGADIQAGPSIDQIYAQQVGQQTRLPSIQLCIDDLRSLSDDCGHGYSCAYTNTISWASPTTPLPMERDPRAVFEQLFGEGVTASEAVVRRQTNRSAIDAIVEQVRQLQSSLGSRDRQRVSEYLEEIRAVERRIQRIEQNNASGPARALGKTPLSVPDSFDEHVALMFDLQALAFMADVTRVASFKMGIDRSQRIYAESGVTSPFHTLSHHREIPEKIDEFAKLNRYHVSKVAGFVERLQDTPDGDGSLLDHALVLYGSPMGDSHVHEHKRLPLFLVGHANGQLKGNLHLRCASGTPMANVLLTLMRRLGVEMNRIGDSTGEVAI